MSQHERAAHAGHSAATFDVAAVRACFPALADGARIYFDNPAGTQVPASVAERVSECLLRANANLGGRFATSVAAGEVVSGARRAMADMLNADSTDEIVFGQNMTTITFALSRALGRRFRRGDEIVLTRMEHDANISPWVALADDHGLTVRWLDIDRERHELALEQLPSLLSARTRLVCVGYASNVLGTVNDVRRVCELARDAGALAFVDAVHYAPHGRIDVQALGCDLLACSAYKFFGTHQGILWGRRSLLADLEPYKVRPAHDEPPESFETGTQSHEGLAGVSAAVDYLASLAGAGDATDRRERLTIATNAISEYEATLSKHLIEELVRLPGVRIHGITDRGRLGRRAPTIAFTLEGMAPEPLARALGERGVYAWHGHNYALEPLRALGLLDSGGVLRVGLVHYNTHEEIDRFIEILRRIAAGPC
jgi:cysteine desulfurase family protein (TIGR01976 family)